MTLAPDGAFIAAAAPAPGGGGAKEPIAAWSWLSESIRKFAEVTMRSPAFSPFVTTKSSARAGAGFDLPRLKISAAAIHKSNLACARLKDSGSRNRQLPSQGYGESHIHKHSQRKLRFGICNFESYFRGAGCLVHLGPDETNPPRKHAARVGVHGDLCGVADLDSTDVVLKNLSVDPDVDKIRDRV